MHKFFSQKHTGVILAFFIFYLWAFHLLETRGVRTLHIIHTSLDDLIPFCEYFIVPYLLWFFYVAAAVVYFAFFQNNKKEYWQFVISLGIGMGAFLLVSWCYPNGHNLRPVLEGEGNAFREMVKILYRVDTPTNILPSIHVFNSLAVAVALDRCQSLRKHLVLRKASWILSVLIILSTMFLKQHSVADVCWGTALYGAVYLAVYARAADRSAQRARGRGGWLQGDF